MAVIHNTTLSPGKLELLAAWLPGQPWYRGAGPPRLDRAGGFRLDDPDGEVGIELMVVADAAGGGERCYHVPLTYRAAPLDGAEPALVGTTEHGVLGLRYVYDGPSDPVLAAQLIALLHGRAMAQAQRISHTADPSVTASYEGPALASSDPVRAASGPDGTDIELDDGLVLRIIRELAPAADDEVTGRNGQVVAGWTTPGGTEHRGAFAIVRSEIG
jgi:Maltokinase N-terminal cap domain